MSSILIQFAHPALEKSRVNQVMLRAIRDLPFVTINDLYEEYPDFDIDIDREQQLLLAHDYILLHHPMYWYSTPAMLKQWEDLTLEHGWAYGRQGVALTGKKLMNVMTIGGQREAYNEAGYNRYTVRQFLAPLEQTARLCKMTYLPPFAVHGTHRITEAGIQQAARQYRNLLIQLDAGLIDIPTVLDLPCINDIIPTDELTVNPAPQS
ncbi:NAD(P)H-dependent oxidoreductase [Spirosoma montaniterrae]|uniref:NAD(P)H oxidoreductase n=1 Tax=Spirosoma montaniterrae TaxID=1178516 RepID=A0A1P9WSQ3_9BACT|nr:NAD(P)H-dependent oxidoreductase [Spirosoma montaniterrae]AQG78426.1 NAD(P)H oxidoreductase [Spirosoma montaniterrae]